MTDVSNSLEGASSMIHLALDCGSYEGLSIESTLGAEPRISIVVRDGQGPTLHLLNAVHARIAAAALLRAAERLEEDEA